MEDEFVTIRTNEAGTEIVQQGRRTAAIRIFYTELQVYVWLNDGHMLGYDTDTDSFTDDGDYRPFFRPVGYSPRRIRPTTG